MNSLLFSIFHYDNTNLNTSQLPITAMLTGTSDPTTSTEGVISQWYTNITSKIVFRCTGVTNGIYSWERLTSGILPQIVVTAPVGSILTCTNGTTILTGTVTRTTYTFEIPNFGIWTVTRTPSGTISGVEVNVDVVKVYYITLS